MARRGTNFLHGPHNRHPVLVEVDVADPERDGLGPAQPQNPGHKDQGTEPRRDRIGELVELAGGDRWSGASFGGFEMKPADRAPWDQIGADRGTYDRDQRADIGTDRLRRQPAAAHLIHGLPDVDGRDRAQGERTERRDEVGAQSRSIPRQGGCTLARVAGQPVLGPLGEGNPSGARIYERAAQDVGSASLRLERARARRWR